MMPRAKTFASWGGKVSSGSLSAPMTWRDEKFSTSERSILAFGMGRSYGDSCLLDDGCMVETRGLDHIIEFDAASGTLRCEAGITLASLLEFSVPRGWFVPVTPGTKYVTVGGCVANDVHGKNHHLVGTFGCFVNRFGLLRSSGEMHVCSQNENAGLFSATIGGLGLTGIIVWVELRLRRIGSPFIRQHVQPLNGLESFFQVSQEHAGASEHTVAWLDATHPGKARGIFIAGNHEESERPAPAFRSDPKVSVPMVLPDFALGSLAIRVLNSTYYGLNARRAGDRTVPYDGFFYPLDAIGHWNRAYGRRGLAQYQFVVPLEHGVDVLRETLAKAHASEHASFLTVVKIFGSVRSPGLLSFPRPGVTVCFDFAHRGAATDRLLNDLDDTIFAAQGALYPAKDARMSRDAFERSFPEHREFRTHLDPACRSRFAERVGLVA